MQTPPIAPPLSNSFSLPSMRSAACGSIREQIYRAGFVGAFLKNPKDDRGNPDTTAQPSWARQIADYGHGEFHGNTPGKLKKYSDIHSSLTDDGAGKAWPNFRYALDLWEKGGRVGPKPYTVQQDYGSCVDASHSELMTGLLGWRASQPQLGEKFYRSAAWYCYGDRGYCGDGWYYGALAAVAMQRGIAFREPYAAGNGKVDFTDDDANEQYVARGCCRSGLPAWLYEPIQSAHPFEDGAFTEFDGDIKAMRAIFAAGGAFNTGGTNTSGGSRPFTIGRVGGHEQAIVGCDDSDEFRKFCQDVIGVKARADDFPVIFHQTWGDGFSGECADKYWPAWWGEKPQGAWVWWASDALRYFRGDIFSVLPRFKGVAGPSPPIPPAPVDNPPLGGTLFAEQFAGGIAIRGELKLVLPPGTSGEYTYIVVPDGSGKYKAVKKQVG